MARSPSASPDREPCHEPELRTAGRYRLLEQIGAGGMGTVYRAHDPNLGRDVAIKTVHALHLESASARRRFDREARALAALRHRNIVAVYDYSGLDADPIYLVTELVAGRSAGDLLRRFGPLPPLITTLILREVAEALTAAHAAGVIHRDIKPGNILVEPSGRVYLADFGLARPTPIPGGESTASLSFAGTPGFMPPEQAQGAPCTARTDLWAWAATAYALATGEAPFDGRNSCERISSRALEAESRPVVHSLGLDREVTELIQCCLAAAPADRPESAAEVLAVLDACIERRRGPRVSRRLAKGLAAMAPLAEAVRSEQPTVALKPDRRARAATATAGASHPSARVRPAALTRAAAVLATLLAITMLAWRPWVPERSCASRVTGVDAAFGIRTMIPPTATGPGGTPLDAAQTDAASPPAHGTSSAPGDLAIRSRHYFDIYIDGRELFGHPLRPQPLPAGTYEVELRAGDCATIRRRVEIRTGETTFMDATCRPPP